MSLLKALCIRMKYKFRILVTKNNDKKRMMWLGYFIPTKGKMKLLKKM